MMMKLQLPNLHILSTSELQVNLYEDAILYRLLCAQCHVSAAKKLDNWSYKHA